VPRRFVWPRIAGWSVLVCGPWPMVAEAASAQQRLGVPQVAIQAEGFE
jgi:ferredoxin-NADP reductase